MCCDLCTGEGDEVQEFYEEAGRAGSRDECTSSSRDARTDRQTDRQRVRARLSHRPPFSLCCTALQGMWRITKFYSRILRLRFHSSKPKSNPLSKDLDPAPSVSVPGSCLLSAPASSLPNSKLLRPSLLSGLGFD